MKTSLSGMSSRISGSRMHIKQAIPGRRYVLLQFYLKDVWKKKKARGGDSKPRRPTLFDIILSGAGAALQQVNSVANSVLSEYRAWRSKYILFLGSATRWVYTVPVHIGYITSRPLWFAPDMLVSIGDPYVLLCTLEGPDAVSQVQGYFRQVRIVRLFATCDCLFLCWALWGVSLRTSFLLGPHFITSVTLPNTK